MKNLNKQMIIILAIVAWILSAQLSYGQEWTTNNPGNGNVVHLDASNSPSATGIGNFSSTVTIRPSAYHN